MRLTVEDGAVKVKALVSKTVEQIGEDWNDIATSMVQSLAKLLGAP